jgi:tricorn protease
MRISLLSLLALTVSGLSLAETRLLRQPDLSDDHLVFVYAGDLYLANTDGSDPRRLTSQAAEENNPFFSPDGQHIAFAADYEGNTDVYVISIDGGNPVRLTWHPADDIPVGWQADGQAVAFASDRETDHGRSDQLYHVALGGGAPERQMTARFFRGQWDADGERLAYIDHGPAYNGLYGGTAGWRGYRGGTSPSIKIIDADSTTLIDIPGERVNDINPFWLGEAVYFISDRDNKIFDLYRFDPDGGQIEQITEQDTWDIRAANGHGGQVVYEAGGRIHRIDANGEITTLSISLRPDLPQTRARWVDVSDTIQGARLSPNGKRALITARGEVFTVPVEYGSTRNLSMSDGVREYPAMWSPDGDQVAWIEESLDGQTLVIEDQMGEGIDRFELGETFNQILAWDAANDRIIYSDNELGLHAIDLTRGRSTLIDRNNRESQFSVSLAPGGRYLAYTRVEANWFHDLYIHDFDRGESIRISDGLADTASPAFSPDGQYLYFAASTNVGPAQFGLDMTSQERPYRAGLYALVLAADGESPLAPRSDDENGSEGDEAGDDDDGAKEDAMAESTTIDFDGLFDRKVALPGPIGNFRNLAVVRDGSLFYIEGIQPGASVEPPGSSWGEDHRLLRFDMEAREAKEVLTGLRNFDVSASGRHLLIELADGSLAVADAGDSLEPETLDLANLQVQIDPRLEWAQIFDEGWRMQRDFFYAANLHGLDWDAVYDQYQPLLAHVGRREDLNALMVEMIAELHAGHNRVGGGDIHRESGPGVGLLGANFTVDNGRWQVTRVYSGESWNPFSEGPLARPGGEVEAGEYILAVNGRNLSSEDNLFEHLHNTAGEQVRLTVGPRADGRDARDVVVEPVRSEGAMRLWGWIEDNRRAVDEATDGRIGYIYLPNTAGAGYTFFNRMFHAQLDKQGLIIDERSNGGGQAANYIVEVLARRHLSNWVYRGGMMSATPMAALHGPKLMMIDQDAGSGGDYLPYAFRELGIGPLLGTRTWGGLIGIFRNPSLVDGGTMTVPHFRFVDVDNNWSVENEGVAPDIEVRLDPLATNAGRDSQLEAAIEEILEMLGDYSDDIAREPPPLPTELGR